jgi:hypothetical protein
MQGTDPCRLPRRQPHSAQTLISVQTQLLFSARAKATTKSCRNNKWTLTERGKRKPTYPRQSTPGKVTMRRSSLASGASQQRQFLICLRSERQNPKPTSEKLLSKCLLPNSVALPPECETLRPTSRHGCCAAAIAGHAWGLPGNL